MKTYLTNLITEKGVDLDAEIGLDGHFGLTYQMLVDFIASEPEHHHQIRTMLVKIDFRNGDVFDYLRHLAKGMVLACGY